MRTGGFGRGKGGETPPLRGMTGAVIRPLRRLLAAGRLIAVLLVLGGLGGALLILAFLSGALRAAAAPGPAPPHPQLVDASRAPATARILKQVALDYAPQMSQPARDQDFRAKVALAKRLLGVGRLVSLRQQSLALLYGRGEVSWEDLRLLRWPGGEQVGVTLSVPVWAPARARRVPTYCGFEKRWQAVAQAQPRPSGFVWFSPSIADINNTAQYRPERIQFEVNSRFAPLAAVFLEYIFREGWYDQAKRVPLMELRAGEDTYAASAYSGPITAECLSFPDDEGDSLAARVALCHYNSLADIYHGRHAVTSNHRLGLAMDLNDFNYAGVTDGPPNPISRAVRQFNRDAMHKLDARHLPAWVYRAAKEPGFRIPQEWTYFGYHTDWAHFDVGTK
jgi:hypothetical protein